MNKLPAEAYAIIEGRHSDPFHYLGLHAEGDRNVVRAFLPYVERRMARGTPLHSMSRHILGLFQGMPHARAWRRHLSENAHRPGAGPEVIEQALSLVPENARPSVAQV